jgi:hypothetical protein
MAEAVFAGKKIKEFALIPLLTVIASFGAIVSRFTQDLFMSYGPCDAGNGDGEDEQPDYL